MSIRELAINRVSEALEASPGEWCEIVVDAVFDAIQTRLTEEDSVEAMWLLVYKELLINGE